MAGIFFEYCLEIFLNLDCIIMTYNEANDLYTRAEKFINKDLQWSNGKELVPCRFIGISGEKPTAEKKDKNYRLFAVLQPEKQKRFTESVASIVRYFEEQ